MPVAQNKLQRIGNSTGVVLWAELLRETGFHLGDEVLTAIDSGFDE